MEAGDNDDLFVVIIDKDVKDTDTNEEISIKHETKERIKKRKAKKPRKIVSKVRKIDEDDSAIEDNGKEFEKFEYEIPIEELKVEQVIETAEKYGQKIDIKVDNVKEESKTLQDNETSTEYLQDYYTDEYSEDELLCDKKNRHEIEFHGIKVEPETEDNETDPECKQDDISDEYSDKESHVERKSQKKISPSKISASNRKIPHRRKMLEESEQFSLVNQLRLERPKLAKDSELLIDTLTDMMLATKKPEPPENVYKKISNKYYRCVKCGASSETEPAAERHWREKHGPRYLFCYGCGADFRSTTALYRHEKRCNAEDAEWVLKARARSLGRKARSRPFLDYDRPKKKKPKPSRRFACALCPNTYTTARALQAHEHAHAGLRPFQCPHCPSAYTSRLGLNKHSVKHTKSEFICDSCGRSLQTKYSLIVHLETHAPVRKFACCMCPRRFTQKAALQLHAARKHSDQPPRVPCKLCDKRFHQMSLLKSHMLKEHGMTLITRKMFNQELPKLTDAEVAKAKVVFNTDVRVAPKPSVTTPDREPKPTASVEQSSKEDKEEEPKVPKRLMREPKLPKKFMEYVKTLPEANRMFVIQNGEAIFVNGENVDYFKQS